MSDLKDPNRDEELEEELTQLVSYLDGELDESQMTHVESRLATDTGMRSHADILSRTWSMLDSIDDVSVSDAFTQDTMATIQAEAATVKTDSRARSAPHRILTSLSTYKVVPSFVLGLIAGLIGLGLSARAPGRPPEARGENGPQEDRLLNQIVIDHLDVLRNAQHYEEIPSAEQLRNVELKDVSDPAVPGAPEDTQSDSLSDDQGVLP